MEWIMNCVYATATRWRHHRQETNEHTAVIKEQITVVSVLRTLVTALCDYWAVILPFTVIINHFKKL